MLPANHKIELPELPLSALEFACLQATVRGKKALRSNS
jgi:hypothetical protein